MSMAELPRFFSGACVVMGVTACGKTSVGEMLAEKFGCRFIEGDKLHPVANVAKMSAGTALNDTDRWPWLETIGESLGGHDACVASCSALKHSYRQAIEKAAQRPVFFIYLHGSRQVLERRIKARRGHFMPASLLDSQLNILEPPTQSERAIKLDIEQPVSQLVEQALKWLLQQD